MSDLYPDVPTGIGIGLRASFIPEVDQGLADGRVPFFEISPENYMERGGVAPARLARIRERFPLLTHGLAMNLGGPDRLDVAYFRRLRRFLDRHGGPWHSDHLCFCGADGRVLHDLLPVPFTSASARLMASRLREASDRLERPMLVENISYYMLLGASSLDEADFVTEVVERADCGLLLDVNNVFVNSLNHGFDPVEWLRHAPLDRVRQMHIAGHESWDGLTIDTHGAPVRVEVDMLLAWVIERIGPVPVVLERDHNIPELGVLLDERDRLAVVYDAALAIWRRRHGRG